MAPDDRRFEDDAFTPSRLPVALKHPPRAGRGRLFAAGGAAGLLVVVLVMADAFVGRAASVTRGPLSAGHALFGGTCENCHTAGAGTPDAKCTSCHEKAGDPLGAYGFARHYLYRSEAFDRSAPAARETGCASCHAEHGGAEASLVRVMDGKCRSCHADSGFRRDHPEFEFAADDVPDAGSLRFPHVMHVKEIVEDESLSDIESACFRCHEPQPDGRAFQEISFARHCDDCHMTRSTATPPLPLATNDAAIPGVFALGTIRRDPAGVAAGAEYWDPSELRDVGGRIMKQPVYHEDPWIIHNLNALRRRMYPGAELAELIRASPGLEQGRSPRVLHEEAIATLRARIRILRSEPSRTVQNELRELEELLQLVARRLEDPFAPVDESRFEVRPGDRAPGLESDPSVEAAFAAVVDSLTAPCQACHVVERATILRVQKDQRTLHRAEFDHRSHIIHAQCLDCHTAIPVREWIDHDDEPPAEQDHAAIQNLPGIATCRDCHRADGPGDRCTTCHLFHPDRSHWANLSRYRRATP